MISFSTQAYSPLEIIRMGKNIEKLDGERVSSASTVLAAMLIHHPGSCELVRGGPTAKLFKYGASLEISSITE